MEDSDSSDVVIVCQGERLKVHRLVLSARLGLARIDN